MKQRLSALAMILFLGDGAQSAGIPTVDAGALAQQIRAYQQQLRDFESQLAQVGLNRDQLAALNRQFDQTLKEYDDYLRQMRGLGNVISRKDWAGLFQTLKHRHGVSAYSRIPVVTATGEAGRRVIDAQVGSLYAVPADADEVRQALEALGLDPSPWVAAAERRRARYEAYRDQLESVKDGNQALLARHRKVKTTKDNFDLGDKSDLNALHTIATANFHLIDELQALNRIQHQRLLHEDHDYMEALSAAEAQRAAEAARLQEALNRARGPRSFRWGALRVTGGALP